MNPTLFPLFFSCLSTEQENETVTETFAGCWSVSLLLNPFHSISLYSMTCMLCAFNAIDIVWSSLLVGFVPALSLPNQKCIFIVGILTAVR